MFPLFYTRETFKFGRLLSIIFGAAILGFFVLVAGSLVNHFFHFSFGLAARFFIGLAVINSVASWLSLFFALDAVVLTAVCLLCFLAAAFLVFQSRNNPGRKAFGASVRAYLTCNREAILICVPFILVALVQASFSIQNYDTPVYHFQSVKWIETFKAIPGLANIQTRMGFNPNVFALFALFSFKDLFGQEIFVVNFLVFCVLAIHLMKCMLGKYRSEGFSGTVFFYCVLFFCLVGLTENLSNPSPDFVSAALSLFVLLSYLEFDPDFETSFISRNACVFLISICCLYAMTIKLTTVPLLILPIALLFKTPLKENKLLPIAGLALFVFFPWLARNIILTGWLVYPFGGIDLFSYDWKVPVSVMSWDLEVIRGYGRSSSTDYHHFATMKFQSWLPVWWHNKGTFQKALLAGAAITPLSILALSLPGKLKPDRKIQAFILCTSVYLVYWFIIAPEIRFAQSIVIASAFSFLLVLPRRVSAGTIKPSHFLILPFFLFAVYVLREKFIPQVRANHPFSKNVLLQDKLDPPLGLNYTFYKAGPVPVMVPIHNDRCFNMPLPCSDAVKKIVARGSSIEDGFRPIP